MPKELHYARRERRGPGCIVHALAHSRTPFRMAAGSGWHGTGLG